MTLGYFPAEGWGGPLKVVQQHALELRRRGYEVAIAASNLYSKDDRIENGSFDRVVDGIEVHYLQTYVLPSWPGTLGPSMLSQYASRKLKDLISQFDVVHVNGIRNAVCMQALRHAHALDIPVVLQPHGTLQYIGNSIRLKKAYDALAVSPLLSDVKAYIALQEEERQQIKAAGADPERVYLVPNGIDMRTASQHKEPEQFYRRFGLSQDKKIILFIGRINRKKGTDLLVEAFALIPEQERQAVQLVIAGPDDGQLQTIQELITGNGLEAQVTLTGLLTGEDVWHAYNSCDLFVLPCRTDTFPMAIVEACAAGKSMVVTDTCEIADLLRDKAALVVPVDTQAIAAAMIRLLQDDDERALLQAGASELMKSTFSVDAVGDTLELIYRDVTGEN